MKYIALFAFAFVCLQSTAFAAGSSSTQNHAVNVTIANNVIVMAIGKDNKASFGVINNNSKFGGNVNISTAVNAILINNGDQGELSIGGIFRK